MFVAAVLGVIVPITLLEPSPPSELTAGRAVEFDLQESHAERTGKSMLGVFTWVTAAFGGGMAAWAAVCWVTRTLLGGTIFGFDPARVSEWWIGLVSAAVLLALQMRTRRSSRLDFSRSNEDRSAPQNQELRRSRSFTRRLCAFTAPAGNVIETHEQAGDFKEP